jgi:hypothetical protein
MAKAKVKKKPIGLPLSVEEHFIMLQALHNQAYGLQQAIAHKIAFRGSKQDFMDLKKLIIKLEKFNETIKCLVILGNNK